MKKSSIITIALLLILSIVAIVVFKKKSGSSTIDKEASAFKIKDTAAIDKIFLADKEGKTILLEKKEDGWHLNGKYRARPDAVELLLYTMSMVDVKSPVSKSAKANVIKLMAAKSTKVEIYSKGEKIKQYYVGHTTQDHTGTFMILTNLEEDENYEDPFITFIPGFEGYLTTRYFTDEPAWRDRVVINLRPPQIKQIKMEFHETPDSSFVIDLFSMQRFGLKSLKNQQQLKYDESRIKQYLAYFQNISCELTLDKKDHIVDSLSSSALPFATLTITDRNQKENSYNFFHKHPNLLKNEQYGKNYKYDPDRLYMNYDNGKEYAIAQFFVFGKILQTYGYFTPKY